MAASADLLEKPGAPEEVDEPRALEPGLAMADRVFHHSARAVATIVLLLTASIGLFLGYQAIPTLHHYGLRFFTESQWQPH
ncbi:MAG: phosphate transport system permease protein, partial [Actinomycetota bacterium]|nr:phosphate transport system permease protein [Actinomycetota bacterium]